MGRGSGGGRGLGEGEGGLGARGHFHPPAIYCTTTWCFALKGLRTRTNAVLQCAHYRPMAHVCVRVCVRVCVSVCTCVCVCACTCVCVCVCVCWCKYKSQPKFCGTRNFALFIISDNKVPFPPSGGARSTTLTGEDLPCVCDHVCA